MGRYVDQKVISARSESLFCFAEFAHDHSDLGAVLNGFSLNETGQLATAVEKTGQAIDATYISTTQLVSNLVSHAYGFVGAAC